VTLRGGGSHRVASNFLPQGDLAKECVLEKPAALKAAVSLSGCQPKTASPKLAASRKLVVSAGKWLVSWKSGCIIPQNDCGCDLQNLKSRNQVINGPIAVNSSQHSFPLNKAINNHLYINYCSYSKCFVAVRTPEHVVLACPNTSEGRSEWLQRAGTVDYRVLTSTRKGLRMTAQRIMELGLLQQFNFAREMVMPLVVS